jgi:hypothetical protein
VIDGSNLVGPGLTATVRFGGVLASSSIVDPSGTVITATSGPSDGQRTDKRRTCRISTGASLRDTHRRNAITD